jgi:hypothetical protein
VKRKGAETTLEFESIPIGELRQDRLGHPAYGLHWVGPPGTQQPSIEWKTHFFELNGEKTSVIEVCKRYLDYLKRFVQAFTRETGRAAIRQ